MATIKGSVLQTGADTTTRGTIPTGITVDGKTAWIIRAMECFWSTGNTAAAADYNVDAVLATINSGTSYNSLDEIVRVNWQLQNTAGVAVVAFPETIKLGNFLEDRVTAQPNLYFSVESAATGVANRVFYTIVYDVVKLSDVELLRLMVGGA